MKDVLYKLYGCSIVYDKEKKRAPKITGKYLGSITEAGGFMESRKRIMEREIEELKSGKPAEVTEQCIGKVKEYGLSGYILKEQKPYHPKYVMRHWRSSNFWSVLIFSR